MNLLSKVVIGILFILLCFGMIIPGCTPTSDPSEIEEQSASQDVETFKMRIMFSFPENCTCGENMLFFEEHVEKYTNGRVEVVLYPNAQLGGPDKEAGMTASGQVEASYAMSEMLAMMDPAESIYTIPFLVSTEPGNADHMRLIIENGKVEDFLRERQKELGLYRLGNVPPMFGTFVLANNVRPVSTVGDARDLKIRIPGGETVPFLMESLGASPIILPSAEVPVALSQNVIDGMVTTLSLYHTSFWHTKYLTLPYVFCSGFPLIVNLDWWNNLPDDIKDIIENEVMPEFLDFAYENTSKRELEYLDEMQEEYGVEVTYLNIEDENTKRVMENVTKKARNDFIEKIGEEGRIIIEEIIKLGEQLN